MEIDKKQFEQLRRTVDENHKMLKQIRSVQRRAWWASMFKWAIIIAISLGAYYIVQPFIENLNNAYDSVMVSFEEVQDTTNSISGFFNKGDE